MFGMLAFGITSVWVVGFICALIIGLWFFASVPRVVLEPLFMVFSVVILLLSYVCLILAHSRLFIYVFMALIWLPYFSVFSPPVLPY